MTTSSSLALNYPQCEWEQCLSALWLGVTRHTFPFIQATWFLATWALHFSSLTAVSGSQVQQVSVSFSLECYLLFYKYLLSTYCAPDRTRPKPMRWDMRWGKLRQFVRTQHILRHTGYPQRRTVVAFVEVKIYLMLLFTFLSNPSLLFLCNVNRTFIFFSRLTLNVSITAQLICVW